MCECVCWSSCVSDFVSLCTRLCLSMKCVDEEYGKGWKGWGKKGMGCSTCSNVIKNMRAKEKREKQVDV